MRKIGYENQKLREATRKKEKKARKRLHFLVPLYSDRNQNAQHLSGIKDEMI